MTIQTQIQNRVKEVEDSLSDGLIINAQDDKLQREYAKGYIAGLMEALRYIKSENIE